MRRPLVTMLAAIAEFERELIRERTGEGRARAATPGLIRKHQSKNWGAKEMYSVGLDLTFDLRFAVRSLTSRTSTRRRGRDCAKQKTTSLPRPDGMNCLQSQKVWN